MLIQTTPYPDFYPVADDKLLALPLLQLPHQVQQPKNCKYRHPQMFNRYKMTDSPRHQMQEQFGKEQRKNDDIRVSIQVDRPFPAVLGNKHTNVHSNNLPQCLPKDRRCLREEVSSKRPKMDGIEVVEKIGCGSYGSIWLVKQSCNQKCLVLKCVELSRCNQQEVENARQEVVILEGLRHPNIVSYKGSFELDHRLHLLMGYCEGGDLFTRIQQQNGSSFPEQIIIRWFIQITMALQYLHAHNILHRDLKSQNVFLTRSGLIKLGDFGVARILGSTTDMASTMIGTPSYMSPELLAGLPYDYKSDIWALGCLLHELATLKHPFPARNMSSLMYKIYSGKVEDIPDHYSEDLQCLVQCVLNRRSELRPSTSCILQQPFIRSHILVFLNDTTNSASAKSKVKERNAISENKKIIQNKQREKCVTRLESETDYGHYSNRNEPGIKQENVCGNEKQCVSVKYNCDLIAKRHKFLPTQFDSLHISEDKTDRTKVETKQSVLKELKCKQQKEHNPAAAGHIDSQSRQRWRSIKKSVVESSSDHDENGLYISPKVLCSKKSGVNDNRLVTHSLSARERRRQKRLEGIEMEKSETQLKQSKNSQEFVEENISTYDFEPSHGITFIVKSAEDEEFFNLLSTTLSEDTLHTINETDANDVAVSLGKESDGLEARLCELTKALGNEIGEDSADLVTNLLKLGAWEVWEEQRQAVKALLGNDVFSSVANIVSNLKLCYTFRHR
ncbi:serine/threonine-protein kinase Nek1 [Procambarus clarkii]|uniref:serine/threonine-protein kinase Nek1 n=1 Tax=Procambarus clarkii TaxID=6728 RepID=UPI003742D4CB